MSPPRAAAVLALLLSSAATVRAQEHQHVHPTPYAGMQAREIKALSSEETASLLAGEGMGFALAAELNGYPGPKHVLELADPLELTAEQRARTRAVMNSMLVEARRLGARVVEGERALDAAFARQEVTEGELRRTVRELGALRGELRGVHLRAHLAMLDILTTHQVERYQVLRGYGDGQPAPGPSSGGASSGTSSR